MISITEISLLSQKKIPYTTRVTVSETHRNPVQYCASNVSSHSLCTSVHAPVFLLLHRVWYCYGKSSESNQSQSCSDGDSIVIVCPMQYTAWNRI